MQGLSIHAENWAVVFSGDVVFTGVVLSAGVKFALTVDDEISGLKHVPLKNVMFVQCCCIFV